MNVFEKVNNLSEGDVLARVKLDRAADGNSYVCPGCGHGKGGDGISPQMYENQLTWHCYGCERHMSNSDLAALANGVDAAVDKARAAAVLSELFGLSSDDADETLEGYAGLYKFCRGNVAKFLAERGGQFRGFKPTTFKKYGLGIHNEFEFPNGQGTGAALIIPYVVKGTKIDNNHFVARSVENINNGERAFAQIGKNPPLFEPMPLVIDGVNFICESATDALSIAQVFDGVAADVGVVAISGAGKVNSAINKLNERFADAERRPKFIVAFDNDKRGVDKGKQLVDELRKSGYPSSFFFLEGQLKGTYEVRDGDKIKSVKVPKVDANALLQQGGGKLFERLIDAISETENTLDEQAAAIRASQESMSGKATEPIDKVTDLPKEKSARAFECDGIASISLGEYFTDKFLLDVSQLTKYAGRKTGFDNLDEKLIAFPPGLVVIGGLPGAGKTTFANQLAQNLAANGEYVFYCSYEMSRLELMSKVVARELFKLKRAGRNIIAPTGFDIRRGQVNHLLEVQDMVKTLSASPAQFHVAELSNTPAAELFEWLKPRIASATKSPVIFIDYMQIVPPDKTDRRDRRESLDNTIRSLKDFQRENGATFVIISSLNRQSYWEPISLESFKETGSLEFSADLLFGLETFVTGTGNLKEQILAATRKAERIIRISCLKNRNGNGFECYFKYFAAFDYFEPIDEKTAKDAAATAVEDNDDEE